MTLKRRFSYAGFAFIEHLIVLGPIDFANTNQKKTVRTTQSIATVLPLTAVALNRESEQS